MKDIYQSKKEETSCPPAIASPTPQGTKKAYSVQDTGRRIRQIRTERNITQEQMATYLHITDRHVRNIEAGQYGASIDVLVAISEFLGVSLDYIILGKRQPMGDLKLRLRDVMQTLSELEKAL